MKASQQRSPYGSDGLTTPNQAEQAIAPFQRVEIDLINIITGSNSQNISIDGEGFFVERADYPVLCAITVPGQSVQQTLVLRDGDKFAGKFRGLTLTTPILAANSDRSGPKLVLHVYRKGSYENSFADPWSHLMTAVRAAVNTAANQQRNYHIPSGMRRIVLFETFIAWATLTSPPFLTVTRLDGSGTATAPSLTFNGQNYNGAATINAGMSPVPGSLANSALFSVRDLLLPPDAFEVAVAWAGTGLAVPQSERLILA